MKRIMYFAAGMLFVLVTGCASRLEYLCTDMKEVERFIESERKSGSKIITVDTLDNSMEAYRVIYRIKK